MKPTPRVLKPTLKEFIPSVVESPEPPQVFEDPCTLLDAASFECPPRKTGGVWEGTAVVFSLFFRSTPPRSRYWNGLFANLMAVRQFYPGAVFVLHHDHSVPPALTDLADEKTAWPVCRDLGGTFWRFTSAGSPVYDRVLVRDIDSVIVAREAEAVEQWRDSGKPFHTMADHPCFKRGVQAGLWGAVKDAFPFDFPELCRWWLRNKGPFKRHDDENFLETYVYPYVERGGLNHCGIPTKFPNRVMFPGGPSPKKGYAGQSASL